MSEIEMSASGSAGDLQDIGKAESGESAPASGPKSTTSTLLVVLVVLVLGLVCADLGVTVGMGGLIKKIDNDLSTANLQVVAARDGLDVVTEDNYCDGTNPGLSNFNCSQAIKKVFEQSGVNVTEGFVGGMDTNGNTDLFGNTFNTTTPITSSYFSAGLCPVNVHWHLGAEHLSLGEFDTHGSGPSDDYALYDCDDDDDHRRLSGDDHSDCYSTTSTTSTYDDDDTRRRLSGDSVRIGFQCSYYDEGNPIYTTEYDWEHCVNMVVGQTYEIHWPHSTVGACGTPFQYQTPFYDGVFCNFPANFSKLGAAIQDNVGVQSQVFTIVNDESYYFPDLIKGALVTGDFWSDVAIYTGSTTGTSRSNDVCSMYSPITWQVDRKCHLISASSFDKMCADMKSQTDDMSHDLYAHGARELVDDTLSSQQVTDDAGR